MIEKYDVPKRNRNNTIYNNNSGGQTTTVIILGGAGQNVELCDNLNSNATNAALTANQGRILNEKKLNKVDAVGKKIGDKGEIFNNYANNIADGVFSHAEGCNTEAKNIGEHAEGLYNKSNTNTISSVGFGTNKDNRKNALEVLKNGDVYINGIGGFAGNNINNSKPLNEAIKKVESADKLSTPRQIWGLSFDGTKDVKGELKDVTNINASGDIYLGDYNTDVNLGAAIFKDEDGHWNLDIDNANIRGHLDVETLQIDEAKYIGGKLYCTKAGIVCSTAAKLLGDNGVFCYFKTTGPDGQIIHNQFQVGDYAFSQTFNNNQLRRWWRKVIEVGTDYIKVSTADCELNSSIPQTGDIIVQLGNETDKDRQDALILEPLLLSIYNEIKTFKLPEPTITLNPKLSKIKGQFINIDTNEDLTTTISNINNKIDVESKKVKLDERGNITNINKSGLVTSTDFSYLFSSSVENDTNIVKQALIGSFVDKETMDASIQAVADKIHYDAHGNITNINKSGLVASNDFSYLFSSSVENDANIVKQALIGSFVDQNTMDASIQAVADKIHYDAHGNITNIDKSGLVLTNDFASLYSKAVNKDTNVVKKAEISTFITEDEANNLVSSATIEADKINFKGKTIINNNFKVDETGNLEINGTIHADRGYFRGFICKGITKINENNIYNYTYKMSLGNNIYTYYFDYEKLSNLIFLVGYFKFNEPRLDLPIFDFPSLYPSNFTEALYDNSTMDDFNKVRQYIGTEIYIYNTSDRDWGITGAITDNDITYNDQGYPIIPPFLSFLIKPNIMYMFKCELQFFFVNNTYEECIYWHVEKHPVRYPSSLTNK